MISKFYQYCQLNAMQEKSKVGQEKSKNVSIETAFSFLTEGKHIISFVGAGGKSSLIDATAKWSSSQGKKVLVTTTTHIFRPQDEFLAMNEKQLKEIWAAGHWAVIGATEEKDPQKLKMPELDWMRQAMELSDLVLIEADGSKRLPCKVPDDHEPVALGRSLKECCFRLEKVKKLLSADENHLLTEKDMAAILLSDQGLRKDVGDRRYIAVLNQCDDSTVRKSAEQVGEMLINSTRQNSETIEKIVFAKLQ